MISCSFHSPPGVLFTFPSRYYFTIGHLVIFSLTRWSSQIHTEFHVLRATRDTARLTHLSITGLSPSMARHSNASSRLVNPCCCPTTPIVKTIGLGFSPFARRYWGSRYLLSLPPATKMFQFAGLARTNLYIQLVVQGVAPFGNSRIKVCFQLPETYRR